MVNSQNYKEFLANKAIGKNENYWLIREKVWGSFTRCYDLTLNLVAKMQDINQKEKNTYPKAYPGVSLGSAAVFLFLMMAFIVWHAAYLPAAEITHTMSFSRDDLSFAKIRDFDLISLPECDFMSAVGDPMLPVINTYMVLPPGTKVKEVRVHAVGTEELDGYFTLYPAQEPVPSNKKRKEFGYIRDVAFKKPNPYTYAISTLYPENIIEFTGEGFLNDYGIASLQIFPVRYRPAKKKITFYNRISFTITYSGAITARMPAGMRDQRVQQRLGRIVKGLVANPEDVEKWALQPRRITRIKDLMAEGVVNYVIITREDLVAAFEPLANWKTKKGIPADIKTISQISSQYPGSDTQEKIRNFIKDYYTNRGTIWVLLGGDTQVVPHRTAFAMQSGGGVAGEDDIPTDLYYSDLNGTWNEDGDSIYGEVEDNIDLYPEVFVGRAPVKNADEVKTFVDKILTYERKPPEDYLADILMLAEKMDVFTDSGEAKDIIIRDFIPSSLQVTMLYEREGTLNRTFAMDHLNKGYHLVNHFAHSWYSSMGVGPDVLSIPDIDALSNSPKYSIMYSISCWPNAIDYDCIAEHFVLNPNGGGVSFVGNTRYGWYYQGTPGLGKSDKYDQEFFKALYLDGVYNIGETLAQSKLAYISSSQNANEYRWVQYSLNLLGDPEMPIWTVIPRHLNVKVSWNTSTELKIVVDSDEGPLRDACVCVQKTDKMYIIDYTDSGGKTLFTLPGPHTEGVIAITVTKHNFTPYESQLYPLGSIPGPPVISSSTHPDQSIAYTDQNPSFSWTMSQSIPKIFGYSYTLDHQTLTVPDEIVDTTHTSTTYTTALEYGEWFFHVRAKSEMGAWGSASHYKVTIEKKEEPKQEKKKRPWWQPSCLF
ncbi:MAG: C25 family cysteine peptidase [bacterium]